MRDLIRDGGLKYGLQLLVKYVGTGEDARHSLNAPKQDEGAPADAEPLRIFQQVP